MSGLDGVWHNQCGSEIRIEVGADGRLKGRMRSPVGLARAAEEFELAGFVQGDALAFTVHFGRHASLTAWVGHHVIEDGAETLRTLWQMSLDVPHAERADQAWRAVWAGADTFWRGSAPAGLRPRRGGSLPPLWSE
jgi:hypothetical protein